MPKRVENLIGIMVEYFIDKMGAWTFLWAIFGALLAFLIALLAYHLREPFKIWRTRRRLPVMDDDAFGEAMQSKYRIGAADAIRQRKLIAAYLGISRKQLAPDTLITSLPEYILVSHVERLRDLLDREDELAESTGMELPEKEKGTMGAHIARLIRFEQLMPPHTKTRYFGYLTIWDIAGLLLILAVAIVLALRYRSGNVVVIGIVITALLINLVKYIVRTMK